MTQSHSGSQTIPSAQQGDTKKTQGPAYPRLETQPMPLKESRRISKGIEGGDIKNPCNINVQNVTEKPSGFILKNVTGLVTVLE